MRRSFAFHDLSNEEFEDLVGHICSEILGTGTIVFATGPDGGRDATFDGCAQHFPSSNSPLAGRFIVQAKHTSNPVASCSDRSFAKLIDAEKPKVSRLVTDNELDHYLVFTNRKKPADKAIAKEKELKRLVPKAAHIFGNDQLRLWLTRHPKIWSNLGFDRFEKKFDIQPNDLTEVVIAFHRAMKDGDTQFESAIDFTFIDKKRKNKINELSKDYFQYMQDHSLQHFKAIEAFLKNPRNEELSARRDGILIEHENLNAEREKLLAIVRDADTFRKYKALQKENAEKRSTMNQLEAQLVRIDSVEEIERKLRDHRRRRDDYVTAIEISLQRGSPIKTTITQLFNRYVMRVLGIHGEFIVSKNKQGNIEFEIKTKDATTGNDTSQDQGHSYRRLLCALFDLSVLKALETTPFYHFVYHDGIFEGLDNRVKLRLLDLLKEYISGAKIEYIFSIIDSDLPRRLSDEKKIEFSDDEIVLILDDKGDQGRLFKMAAF